LKKLGKKIYKFLNSNENENTDYLNLRDTAKAVLTVVFEYIRVKITVITNK
jgi:hypothetical protein